MIAPVKVAVSVAWYFYVAWGPAITIAGIYFGAFRNWPFPNKLFRYIAVTAMLTLVAGPAFEQGWAMTWWMVPVLRAKHLEYYVWQYGIFCFLAQVIVGGIRGMFRGPA
jgi:hypothetical protein